MDYYLWPRRRGEKKAIYYVQFKNVDGSLSLPKSTKQTSESAAHRWVHNYIASGQIVTKANFRFKDYATNFFSYDGPYIQKRLTRKGRRFIGKRHADNMAAYLKNYIMPYFQDAKLADITKKDVEAFQDALLGKTLSSATVNHVVTAFMLIMKAASSLSFFLFTTRERRARFRICSRSTGPESSRSKQKGGKESGNTNADSNAARNLQEEHLILKTLGFNSGGLQGF